MRTAVLALATLLLAAPVQADEEYDACIEQSDDSNQAWALCGNAWIEREDDRLNEAWKRLLDGASEQMTSDLRAEQRAWNSYKELSCLFYANGEFGREGQVLSFPACRAAVIANRTAELDAYEAGEAEQ